MAKRKYVGKDRVSNCPHCEKETEQYVYHNGNWVCCRCGKEVEENE